MTPYMFTASSLPATKIEDLETGSNCHKGMKEHYCILIQGYCPMAR